MTDAKPYPKAIQLGRGERRYRRKVASAKRWAAIMDAKRGPCRVCKQPTRFEKDEATADEGKREDGSPAYSDRVTLDGFITWVVHGKAWKQARQPVDA